MVRRRIDAGDVTGAVRILVNDGKLVEPNEATAQERRNKHPDGALPPREHPGNYLRFTDRELEQALKGLQTAGAPGPDGLRPCHIKQFCGLSAGDAGNATFRFLSEFINLCLSGNIPSSVRPLFFGASLCALRKKDGGLRPIAFGLVLGRIVSRLCCVTVRERISADLAPYQVGVEVRSEAESAVHATRSYLQKCENDSGIVKLDFKNAFNCVDRNHMIKSVKSYLPELEAYVRSSYGVSSMLLFGKHRIKSSSGVQQGDPLGPLLFTLAVRSLSHESKAPFSLWYLDDATLGGTASEVLSEIIRIRNGLH